MWLRHGLGFRSLRSLEVPSGESKFIIRHSSFIIRTGLRSRRSEKRTLAEHGDVPVRRSVQDCATRGNIRRFIAAQIRHTRGRDCEAASSSRRVERICKISVFPAPLARAHWLALKNMQCFTCFADALAFRGRSLVLRKEQRILAILVLKTTLAVLRRSRLF